MDIRFAKGTIRSSRVKILAVKTLIKFLGFAINIKITQIRMQNTGSPLDFGDDVYWDPLMTIYQRPAEVTFSAVQMLSSLVWVSTECKKILQ